MLRFAVRRVRVLPRTSQLPSCAFTTYTPQCRVLFVRRLFLDQSSGRLGRPACCDLSQAFRSIRRSSQSLNQHGLALKSGELEMLHGVPKTSPN